MMLCLRFSFQCALCLYLLFSLMACGGDSSQHNGPVPDPSSLQEITAYLPDTAYGDILKPCVLSVNNNEYCSLSTLPLLVEDAAVPGVEHIMARVLVSHPWMGLRLRQVLETLPGEILQLFASVTTIVIDDNIRPSFYLARSSTIYLDPDYLWLTNTEKATVGRAQDYRSEYNDALAFLSLARYVDGFENAWFFYSLEDNEERTIADIRLALAKLLLHELAHANDFFPPEEIPYLDLKLAVNEAYEQLNSASIYRRLNDYVPLNSSFLFDLAGIIYRGETASAAQTQWLAAEVGAAMEAGIANDDYAYSSVNEDVAMLFEEAMMKFLFDIDRDIAYTARPDEVAACSDFIVAWGMRGRLGDSVVKDRARFVVEAIYPGRDFSLFFQGLPAPTMMRPDESWCENLALF